MFPGPRKNQNQKEKPIQMICMRAKSSAFPTPTTDNTMSTYSDPPTPTNDTTMIKLSSSPPTFTIPDPPDMTMLPSPTYSNPPTPKNKHHYD
ncbi:unnamed protein product [Rhizophagus irregularis]|nr:unnamed protein product [Rhizophagus irregularis]